MPIMKSAKKRLRQNVKRNLRNRIRKTALRTQMKKFFGALEEKNVQSSEEQLRVAIKKIDKCASKGILHKKTADRKKSRLTKKLNQIKTAAQPKS
jgi:small subunit ribosomal protein S20